MQLVLLTDARHRGRTAGSRQAELLRNLARELGRPEDEGPLVGDATPLRIYRGGRALTEDVSIHRGGRLRIPRGSVGPVDLVACCRALVDSTRRAVSSAQRRGAAVDQAVTILLADRALLADAETLAALRRLRESSAVAWLLLSDERELSTDLRESCERIFVDHLEIVDEVVEWIRSGRAATAGQDQIRKESDDG